MLFQEYDVIVVGAGHAGCEAAVGAANLGSRVLLVTMNMETIAKMSCNPAMGGVAKGQIVREIDALGGYSGIVTDHTMLQFRMLNRSKGPAMWSPRAQCDRMRFADKWRLMLEAHPNIDFWQEMVGSLIVENGRACGIVTSMGIEIRGKAVVLTNGTFLNGVIHIGEKQLGGGRAGESAAKGITEQLVSLGFEAQRMKTGTPARIDGRTINWSALEVQDGEMPASKFSYTDTPPLTKSRPCHIAYTSQKVHDMLKTGFDRSPMFNGRIQGLGPRYCPSIEDKINRFADKSAHQLFVEPEGWDTCEIYLNGFSSSLPAEVQLAAMRLIEGFENVKMFRPGYAIEYDFFPPTQLKMNLETRLIKNLFFAGQINGTTGYEEAACQGLMAGINAHRTIREEEAFILRRSDAYIGVLIDDLVSKGTEEPYRMFTSRAEYRILLRQDNADTRLTPIAAALGLPVADRLVRVEAKAEVEKQVRALLDEMSVEAGEINGFLAELDSAPVNQKTKLSRLLLRPHVDLNKLSEVVPQLKAALQNIDPVFLEAAEISIKYEGYIIKEQETVAKISRLEDVKIPQEFDFRRLQSLSIEARDKLSRLRPATVGQATRVSGVSPSDISVLLVFLGR
jgi:tRNA uridine 5-carboxymethylaminomethyl modification enzyme